MIEKPIVFSGPMVRAGRAGRTMQMRRVIKGLSRHWVQGITPEQYRPGEFAFLDMADPIGTYPTMFAAPYAPGDILWVKERWGIFDASPTDYAIAYRADNHNGKLGECYWFTRPAGEPELEANGKWRSPIFMPRWASRISVNVLTVRCERIQDTTEEDAKWVYVYEFERR